MLTRYDWILIYFLLLLVAISLTAVVFLSMNHIGSEQAVIFLRGREVARVDLTQEKQRFKVGGCLIEIAQGRVRVASSTCPNKICVSTGWIKQPTQIIVCAPQKVVVKIEGSSSSGTLDAVNR